MIGIYKITSPVGKIYIGQSRHIELRKLNYVKNNCKNQVKIYNSILKYGWEKHKFEILIECEINQLNDLELYYSNVYDSIGFNGLNLRICGGNTAGVSEETKLKMSISHRGNKNIMFGKTHSSAAKEKISITHRGKKLPTWMIDGIIKSNTGRIKTHAEIEKLRAAKIGVKRSELAKAACSLGRKDKKPIVAIKDCAVIEINSLCAASKLLNRDRKTINQALANGFNCYGYKLYYL